MERLRPRDLRSVLVALQELYSFADLHSFPTRIFAALPNVVAADLLGYNEVDTLRTHVEGRIEPFSGDVDAVLQIYARHMHEHPVVRRRLAGEREAALKVSDFLTQREFHQLGLYGEFYRMLEIEYQLALSLPASPSLIIGFTLNRTRRDFSERERLLLNVLRPHVVQAYANARAVTLMRQRVAAARSDDATYGVIELDRSGRVRKWSDEVRNRIETEFGGPRSSTMLPEHVARWVSEQLSGPTSEAGLRSARAPLVSARAGTRLVLRLLAGPSGDQHLVLMEARSSTTRAVDLETLGLSRREAEVLFWVAIGTTNREVATILALSPLTVRTHLEHVYQKLGVETRTAATVRALEALGWIGRFQDRP